MKKNVLSAENVFGFVQKTHLKKYLKRPCKQLASLCPPLCPSSLSQYRTSVPTPLTKDIGTQRQIFTRNSGKCRLFRRRLTLSAGPSCSGRGFSRILCQRKSIRRHAPVGARRLIDQNRPPPVVCLQSTGKKPQSKFLHVARTFFQGQPCGQQNAKRYLSG